MSNAGIDYGRGVSNRDPATGIHYGVINYHSLSGDAAADFEDDYDDPMCPKCGVEVMPSVDVVEEFGDDATKDYHCPRCDKSYYDYECTADESIGFSYDKDGYLAHDAFDKTCVFVTKSPFYTYTRYCSPCAPGAGNLDAFQFEEGNVGVKTYCFGRDWFEDGKCPYRVWRVSDDTEVRGDE